ncbi:MAG: hypothetical protein R3F34_18340 [Planctomycetota bacterium]
MNDTTTVEDRFDVTLEDAPPAKGGVPKWVWGCGGGCLLVMVAVIGFTIWFFNKLMAEIGPEAAWPVVAEVMPYGPEGSLEDDVEARPAGYVPAIFERDNFLVRTFASEEDFEDFPFDAFLVITKEPDPSRPKGTGVNAMLIVFDGLLDKPVIDFVRDGQVLDEVAKGERIEERSEGRRTLEFQGREIDTFHIEIDPEPGQQNPLMPDGEGPEGVLLLDVTGDRQRSVLLMCIATGEAEASVEEIEAFLRPFRVWDGR